MPAPRSLLEDLPFHLARATLGFRRFNDQTLRAVGLEAQAPGLATVLHALSELGESPVRLLVEKTHLPNGTLTGLLDSLERDGLIQRTRNPSDGRSWLVGLTKRGRSHCKKLQERHRIVMEAFREALSEAEAAELTGLLDRLTTRMREYGLEPQASARARHPRGRTRGQT